MNEVIMLAREYERLITAARKVVGDWKAAQQMAGQIVDDEPMPSPPKWASLTALERLVDHGELP